MRKLLLVLLSFCTVVGLTISTPALAGSSEKATHRWSMTFDASPQWMASRNESGDPVDNSGSSSRPFQRLNTNMSVVATMMLLYQVHQRVLLGLAYMFNNHSWSTKPALVSGDGGNYYTTTGVTSFNNLYLMAHLSLVHFMLGQMSTWLFLNGGVGGSWARTRSMSTDTSATGTTTVAPYSSSAFSYFVGLGLAMHVTRMISLQLGARFIGWGKHKFASTETSGPDSSTLSAVPAARLYSVGSFFAVNFKLPA